ncbi:YkgJ family cysteine cluster protein [Malonomonas rubra]|uniref:YkgJ family cysteine cluster protein n=1 Tax=Malonomonas rubra TaxID=57040 RepID=UPI0026F2D4C1|nr:YkgJ family cysteine cluster protein [Malonomonas rubra]
MAWEKMLAELETSRQNMDQQLVTICTIDSRTTIYCAKGCSNCCSLSVNCSFPEAAAIAQSLTSEQRQYLADKLPTLHQICRQAENLKLFLRLFRNRLGGCSFLDKEGRCSIYPQRPFSCRSLLSTRNSNWCAVDFAELHPQEKEAFLSSLDRQIVAFPTHYLAASQELGLEYESLSLSRMRDSYGFSISGNLLYQVWLETEHRLSEVIKGGYGQTRRFLKEQGLDLPFLLQLRES